MLNFNVYYLFAIVSVIVASCSQILLKKGAMKEYPTFLREYLNPYVIIGYGMMFLSLFLTMLAYRGMAFMNVPVIEALGYILVPILSWFFFKEGFTRKKVMGILCILAGITVYYI